MTTDRGDRALAVHKHGLVLTGPRKRSVVVPWARVHAVRTDAVGLHLATDQGVVTLPQSLDRTSGIFGLVTARLVPAADAELLDTAPTSAPAADIPAPIGFAGPATDPAIGPTIGPVEFPEPPAQTQPNPWFTAGVILLVGVVVAVCAVLSIRAAGINNPSSRRPAVAARSASTAPQGTASKGGMLLSAPTQQILTADSTFMPAMLASLHAKGIIKANYLSWDASEATANVVVEDHGWDVAYSYRNGRWGAPRRTITTSADGNKIDTRTVTFDYIAKVRAWLEQRFATGWVQTPRASVVSGGPVPTLMLRTRDTTIPAVHDGAVCCYAERIAFIDLPTGNYYAGEIEKDFPESCT